MWVGLTFCIIIFCIFVIIEESIYYFWNRYVYGPNVETKMKWKKRVKRLQSILIKKPAVESRESNQEKSSL
ncbi:hypothetical protein QNH20_11280 [Neobacillus sp. WH10]|uniref:hypothetical protein n=1 Tax=Neobacillus sp. WH10 TaxID=3047873 RepID=UPI0024C1DC59|nr:hypothetical protein [Neobacillus sp. WH10]WHY79684.1 hypothetical protein QNH20_11280 [Neobacillus sp. WH10]